MVSHRWQIFLVFLLWFPQVQALAPGDRVPDFIMPSTAGQAYKLSEHLGQPMMLVWLGGCNDCDERIVQWQYVAESLTLEGLRSWFVWYPRDGQEKTSFVPESRLPVLKYEAENRAAWWLDTEFAIMLISPAGVLDYLFLDDIENRQSEIAQVLKSWLTEKRWFEDE